MIEPDELAAIAAALSALTSQDVTVSRSPQASFEGLEGCATSSRWKLADRNPDLEIEDLRVL
ncbi:MAG TPA: hypothetical protein VMD47_11070 [Candidatus Acidoferrales bacterium]|nr:hypothetical protein [Candidatus Acidoferrales bacterium]